MQFSLLAVFFSISSFSPNVVFKLQHLCQDIAPFSLHVYTIAENLCGCTSIHVFLSLSANALSFL